MGEPGSAVLTLTSAGMVALSRARGTTASREGALWNSCSDGVQEISLAPRASAILLSVRPEPLTRWTADGRCHSNVPALALSGVRQLHASRTRSGGSPFSERSSGARGAWTPIRSSVVQYVNLGNTGLRVSRLCLGMMSFGPHESRQWALPESEAEPIVRRAVEGGITFFDTADVYNGGQSEVITGRVLSKLLSREEFVLATKVHGQTMPGENGRGLSRKHVMASINASLGRLGMDYVDLYQIHRWDYTTPIGETMEALHDVVKAGKARYIGASSMFAWQFAKAQATADGRSGTRFVSMQNHYNLVYREEEREMIPQCIDQGVAILPWSPLARGLLAGNRTRSGERLTTRAGTDAFGDSLYTPDVDFDVVDRVTAVAAERNVPSAQVALAWLLGRQGVTAPIVGATKVGHVEDALAAEQLELTPEEVARLEEPYVPHAISGHA